jgi:hypothetical protein
MTVASQVNQTLTSLKGVQGTIRIYSTQTQDKETMSAFKEALETTEGIINDLENRVQILEYQESQYKGK